MDNTEKALIVTTTLKSIIPTGFEIVPAGDRLILRTDDIGRLRAVMAGASRSLANLRDRLDLHQIDFMHGVSLIGSLPSKGEMTTTGGTGETPTHSRQGSYGSSRLAYDASPEAIEDFIRGKEYEGYVVTVTSLNMGSDRAFKPLYLNGAQVRDRFDSSAPGSKQWTVSDWLENGFLKLWRDSFRVGHPNYFAELLKLTQPGGASDGTYRDFLFDYRIRRPSGALAEYQTWYIPVSDYLGVPGKPEPARIGVSRVGDWRIVEEVA